MSWTEHLHATAVDLAAHVASELEATLREALAARGRAVLALAGGQTPWPAYRALATADIDWSRVVLVPTDERCVAHAHPANNAAAIERAFDAARGVQVLQLVAKDGGSAAAEAFARTALASMHELAFDAVVLGMGGDAHTASLFPQAAQLTCGLDMHSGLDALRIDPVPLPPEAPFPRISLTLPRLLRAGAIHLLVSGAAKRDVLHRAMRTPVDVQSMPIAAVLHARGAYVQIHWSPS